MHACWLHWPQAKEPYSEEMLDDIDTRRKIITKVDEEAKKLLDEIEKKLADWEAKLVALGNAEDKAKSLMDAAKLEREKLNGEKTVLGKSEGEAENAAKIMIPPYEREIYVIVMIKKKVSVKCAGWSSCDRAYAPSVFLCVCVRRLSVALACLVSVLGGYS